VGQCICKWIEEASCCTKEVAGMRCPTCADLPKVDRAFTLAAYDLVRTPTLLATALRWSIEMN